ncbi:MAG: ferrous iron transport protein A [Hydrogenophaga sp.]|nr:ferrous iron transport protein A [Hydrogenophaga sp.]
MRPDRSPVALDAWPLRTPAVLQGFCAAADGEVRRTLHRLAEIGFLPGEPLEVVARAGGRGGPIAVRVGGSTFALRAHEAALLRVQEPA